MPSPAEPRAPAPIICRPTRTRLRRRLLTALGAAFGLGIASAASLPAARGQPAGARAAEAAERTLLVLGDSLSAEYGLNRGKGWVALLSERLTSHRPAYRVVNASISGETTAGGRSRLDGLLARHRPSVVVIELGGNDALRGLDLKMMEANLTAMARAARQAGAKVLLLGMTMPPNYGRSYAEAFQSVFQTVATREQAALLPFFLDGVGERIEMFQADRIHPNEKAQPRLLENVWPALAPLLR